MIRPPNSVREPVVKSCNRVPTANTTSAAAAARFAAAVPVTPIAPRFSAWSCASAPLPACVSVTGIPCAWANRARSSVASEYSTPPPATINGARAARSAATAPASSSASGRGRRGFQTRGAKNAAGQSNASAWVSWHSASVTGPHSAGSVSTAIARGSAVSNCSGRAMRSK